MTKVITSIDIVSSAFNEEECIEELISRISKVMSFESSYKWRLIIFDNGSTDNTWELIREFAKRDSRILGLRMSRNFSLDAALTSGIDIAEADIAILMASDLQDPPEAIPQLLRKYEEGFEQVLVKVTKRQEVPWPRRLMSTLFYRSANWMTDGMLPELVSDFRLLSRGVYQAIAKMRESHRFLRGLGAWVGFRTTFIELERPARFAGESKWLKSSLLSVIQHAIKSIFSHSSRPLVWVSSLGLFLSLGSLLTILGMSIVWILGSVPFAGFGTIVGLISLGFSLTMLCIGILAQYLALIYEEVKQRPLYIIAEKTY
jgi:glycosyltransferase involved in cell wall biosynthesis